MLSRRALPSDTLTYAILYSRVSSEDQRREGISLDVQLAECRRYAAAFGWVLASEHQDVLSGSRDDRPAYRALLQECRDRRAQGQAVAVVVLRLDRFGRRLLERVRSRDELKQLGVPVHSVREGGEVSDLVSNILASVAQEEVRQLGERVSDARQHLARAGWWGGGRPPWGYRLRPATPLERADGSPLNVLDLDPETAPFAAEAASRFVAGASVHDVARWVGSLPAPARQGRQFGYVRVRAWLVAEAPRGLSAGQPARWPAILTPAQIATIDARVAGWQAGRRQPSGRYLLTGLLRCARCGTTMVGSRGSNTGTTRYICNQWRRNVVALGHCSFGAPVGRLDALVLETVRIRLLPLAAQDRQTAREVARAWQTLTRGVAAPTVHGQQQLLERARAQAQRRLRDAATLYVDGGLDRGGYEAVRTEAEAGLQAATEALARLATPVPVALPDLSLLRDLARAWPALAQHGDRMATRAVLVRLIQTITPQRAGYRAWTLEVRWTALGEALGELVAYMAPWHV